MSSSDGVSSQEASVTIKTMLKKQENIEILERRTEEQRLRAERDAPRKGTGGGAVGGREKQLRGNKQRRLCRHRGCEPNQAYH